MARKRYLKKTPLIEARELFLATVDPSALAVEEIAVDDGLDRITAEPVFAKISSPHYHASAMDGICVRAEDTFGATEFVGKTLTLADSDLPAAGIIQIRRHRQRASCLGQCRDHDRESAPDR